jgi:hypothetical protein
MRPITLSPLPRSPPDEESLWLEKAVQDGWVVFSPFSTRAPKASLVNFYARKDFSMKGTPWESNPGVTLAQDRLCFAGTLYSHALLVPVKKEGA